MIITSKVWYQNVVLLQIYHKNITFNIFSLLYSKILDISEIISGITFNDILCMTFEKSLWLTTLYTKSAYFLTLPGKCGWL